MSYILDALRRADAERRRGQSPVLHDVAGLSLPPPARRPTLQRLLPWLAGGLLLTGGLLWAWRATGSWGIAGACTRATGARCRASAGGRGRTATGCTTAVHPSPVVRAAAARGSASSPAAAP
jgi:general secretion pathway protein B